MKSHQQHTSRRIARSAPTLALICASLGLAGCGSLANLRRDTAADRARDQSLGLQGIQGPTERLLNSQRWNRSRQDLARTGDPQTQEALAKYDEAEAKYNAGEYAVAEKLFKRVAKSRRDPHESQGAKMRRNFGWADHDPNDVFANFGDPIEEDALFMVAQCQFAKQDYATAQDSYNLLLNRYPSTRHLDASCEQLFRIAKYWLGFPDAYGDESRPGEVRLASGETLSPVPTPEPREPGWMERARILPNFNDRTRPMFDTTRRAEQALTTIWLKDATGPRAADALMMAANHNLREADYVEAARLYELVREQYPDSTHVEDAYLLESHVKLATYQGPAYDGRVLTESRQLKEQLLAVFPDLTPEQQQELQEQVGLLQEAEVERLWRLVEFYGLKGQDPSVVLHCHALINQYPDSPYAEMARKTLENVERRQQARSRFRWPFGGGSDAKPAAAPPVASNSPREQPAPGEPKKFQIWNPLRRAETPPDLQPAEAPAGAVAVPEQR